jgi:hypothetical protein
MINTKNGDKCVFSICMTYGWPNYQNLTFKFYKSMDLENELKGQVIHALLLYTMEEQNVEQIWLKHHKSLLRKRLNHKTQHSKWTVRTRSRSTDMYTTESMWRPNTVGSLCVVYKGHILLKKILTFIIG